MQTKRRRKGGTHETPCVARQACVPHQQRPGSAPAAGPHTQGGDAVTEKTLDEGLERLRQDRDGWLTRANTLQHEVQQQAVRIRQLEEDVELLRAALHRAHEGARP